MCKDMTKKQTWEEVIRQKYASTPHFIAIRAGRKHYGKPRGIPQTLERRRSFADVQRCSELMVTRLPPRKWAVEGLIPEGYSVLGGGKSAGKSWLALNISLAVAMGELALGKIPTEQGTVLYLSLEDDQQLMQERCKMLLGDAEPPYELALVYAEPDLNTTLLEKLETWFVDYPDTRLVIIDLFAKVKPSNIGHGDRYQEEYNFADGLQILSHRASVPIMLLTHTNQTLEKNLDDPFHNIAGSTGLLAPARAMLRIVRKRNEPTMTLDVSGKGVREHKYNLKRDEQWHITIEGTSPKPTLAPELQDIIALLRKEGRRMSAKEVANALDVEYETMRSRLKSLNGWVISNSKGYQLNPLADTPV